MTLILTDSDFGPLVEKARNVCEVGPVVNLILEVETGLPAAGGAFIRRYIHDAERWQLRSRPESLHFNHGEYMHSDGDPLEYLAAELKTKPTGNRACVVLPDNKAIQKSGDGQLPSLMLMQAGRDISEPKRLILTAYYRALEVSRFLPVNLAELCVIADQIQLRIPEIAMASINVHAFRAHVHSEFRAHERSRLDWTDPLQLEQMVLTSQTETLADWLVEKSEPETVIEIDGITRLATFATAAKWSQATIEALERAGNSLVKLAVARRSATHAPLLNVLQEAVADDIRTAAALVREEG